MPNPFGAPMAAASTGGNPFGAMSNGQLSGQSGLNSVDELLNLATSQGGSIAAAAQELVHPTSGILSTISDGFKNSFHKFVDIISTPSEVIAGSINSFKNNKGFLQNIDDAIKNNISPADVLFGKENPNNNGMQKVGSFLTRTAVNVLLDPLTYVTFGAGQGLFGLRAGTQLTLGENAIANIAARGTGAAVKKGGVASLSKEGQELYSFAKKLERQMKGSTSAEIALTGDATKDMVGNELSVLLKNTVDSPLNPDFARQALSKTLEKNPGLTQTLLDKGGIKFFGKSVLSGQRMASVMKIIPGMTMLDNITKPARAALSAPFDPAAVKVAGRWERLPPEYMDSLQNYKDLAATWADKSVGDVNTIIKANNLSIPESKFLTAAIESGYRPADAALGRAWDQFFKLGEEQYAMMKSAGIPVQYLNRYVPHMLLKEKVKSIPFRIPPSAKVGAAIHRELVGPIFKAGADDLARIEKELVATKVAGEATGKAQKGAEEMLAAFKNDGFEIFEDNIAMAWIGRSMDNVRGTAAKYFMRNVAEQFGAIESVAKEVGHVPINAKGVKNASEEFVNRVFGESGEQMLYHPAIAEHIENFMGSVINDDAMKDAFTAYDKIQNFWKASVTSYFPAFHGRNAISNALQNYMDLGVQIMNPMYHFQAGKMIVDNRESQKLVLEMAKGSEGAAEKFSALMSKPYFTDRTGHAWTFGELQQVSKSHGIAFHSGITSMADIAKGPAKTLSALFPDSGVKGAAKKLGKGALDSGPAVGQAVENQARLVNFMANLRNTGDVMLAAKRTKQFLFDYQSLTGFEKNVLRRLIPFYTYSRKNLELQVRTLFSTPGRISQEVQGLQTLGEVISGGEGLTDEEQAALPQWMRSGIGILTKKNGEIVTMLSSLGTPIEQPFAAMQANQFLGSLSPLIRVPIEQAAGYSFFQGKPLSEVTNATAFNHAPQVIKDFIGYTQINAKRSDGSPFQMQVALHPERMNILLNLPPTTRVFSALKQMDAVDVSTQQKVLQQLIGIKPYSFDLVQEAQKRQNEMKKSLETLLTNAGVTAQFKTTYIPKDKQFDN